MRFLLRCLGIMCGTWAASAAGPAPARAAEYELVFEGLWDATHITTSFPAGAHFTTLIGATHDAGDPLWSEGGLATPGIERVAEEGLTFPLSDEISARIADGSAGVPITAAGIFGFPAETSTIFSIDARHPEVSLISMVAPSPDWFVGVSGLSLSDANGWIPNLAVDLMPYDAGTEDGNGFSLNNLPTVPQEPIGQLGSPFVPGAAIGRLHLTLLPEPPAGPSTLVALATLAVLARLRRRGSRRRPGD